MAHNNPAIASIQEMLARFKAEQAAAELEHHSLNQTYVTNEQPTPTPTPIKTMSTPYCKIQDRIIDLDTIDFDDPQFHMEWLVDGMISKGSWNMLLAHDKVGKTSLALILAKALATGGTFLDKPVKKCKVAFVPMDGSFAEFGDKFKRTRIKEECPDNFALVKTLHVTEVDEIKEFIRVHQIDVLMIDTLSLFFVNTGVSINDDKAATLLKQLRLELKESGVTVVITHHMNKNHEAQGTHRSAGNNQIPADMSNVFALTRLRNGNILLDATDVRSSAPMEIELSVDFVAMTAGVVGNYDSEVANSDISDKIRHYLLEQLPYQPDKDEIAKNLGYSTKWIDSAVKSMPDVQVIKGVGRGKKTTYKIEPIRTSDSELAEPTALPSKKYQLT